MGIAIRVCLPPCILEGICYGGGGYTNNLISEKFGACAGNIWDILSRDGPSSESEIKKKAGLRYDELFGAIGWLARENKIRKDEQAYSLGDTNLTYEIGTAAGKVWEILNSEGELNVTTLSRRTEMKKKELFAALGWLARENKVESDDDLTSFRLQ